MFFARPGSTQPCPKSADCWSPATPAIGIAAPSTSASVAPKSPLESRTSGSIARGTPSASSRNGSQSPSWMSKSSVRDAFDGSVANTRPPVSFQISHVSTVPKQSSPASARACAPSTASRMKRTFVPEK